MHPPDDEQALITRLLDLPPGDQEAALREACTTTPDLRDHEPSIRAALEAHRHSRSSSSSGSAMNNRDVARVLALALEAPADEAPGCRVGAYKLLQELGEGGFGVVWMAEQSEPIRRRVALKIIKRGMDTREVIARFETERQALAMMDHPNIAHVLDAGATASGRPYFAMELVRGVPITRYCNEQRLSIEQRLSLFTRVCHAVQHAHQKGVIHRDLKPSNILVTLHDGVPVPKVIDFGIAKATSGPLTDQTLFTQFHTFLGTPAYTSPEQMEMSGMDVDTRSDIYSLGVLFYELLTGTPPFDPEELRKSGLEAMRAIIREKDPLRPSQRLRALDAGALTTAARQRSLEPARLAPALSGDLDWIAMHCLEKDRTRRYGTASGLAADIERFLAEEPVVARPPSTAYRFSKFVRRHRLGFVAGSVVACALIAGFVVSTLALVRESAARRREVVLHAEAETSARRSDQVARFMKDMLGGVGPKVAQGRDTTLLREILDTTAARIDRELRDQPEVAADLRTTLASVYTDLADYATAEKLLRESITVLQAADPARPAELATALDRLGETLNLASRPEEAVALLEQAVALREGHFGRRHLATADALYHLSSATRDQVLSKKIRTEVFSIRAELLPADDPERTRAIFGMAGVAMNEGDLVRGLELHRQALEQRLRILGSNHPDVAQSLQSVGLCEIGLGRPDKAALVLREALETRLRVLGAGHPQTAATLFRLAGVTSVTDEDPSVLQITEEMIAAQRTAPPASRPALAGTLLIRAWFAEFREHAPIEAARMRAEAKELFMQCLRDQTPIDIHLYGDATIFVGYKFDNGAPTEGQAVADCLIEVCRRLPPADERVRGLRRLIWIDGMGHYFAGRFAEANARFDEIFLAPSVASDPNPQITTIARAIWADSLHARGRSDEAWKAMHEGLAVIGISPPYVSLTAAPSPALLQLGRLALHRGELELAATALTEARARSDDARQTNTRPGFLAYPVERYDSTLGLLQAHQGRFAEADVLCRDAIASLEPKISGRRAPPPHILDELRANLAEVRRLAAASLASGTVERAATISASP